MVRTRTFELAHDKQQLYAVLLSCPFSGIGKTKTSFCGLVADSVLKNRVLNAYLVKGIFREVSKMHDSDAYLVRECLKRPFSEPC